MLVFKVHVEKVGIYLGGHTDTPNSMECKGNQCTAGRSLELLLKSKGMIELTKIHLYKILLGLFDSVDLSLIF